MKNSFKLSIAALIVAGLSVQPAMAGGKDAATAAPKGQGELGIVVINPYKIAPLTAIIDLGGKRLTNAEVTIRAKGKKGIDISYDVQRKAILTHNGIPLFGLYANYMNVIDVKYQLESGEWKNETYKVQTQPIYTNAVDGQLAPFPENNVQKVAKGFEDRLYFILGTQRDLESKNMQWSRGGAADWNSHPSYNYVTDTAGDVRWYLSPFRFDGTDSNEMRGVMMGWHQMDNGEMIVAKGQSYMRYDLLGRKVFERRLPRGYIDHSHEIIATDHGTYMIRVAKKDYHRPDGKVVNTVRDYIIEIDATGNVVEEWDLNTILDPTRDVLIKALDSSAVCLNIDMDKMGKKVELEPDAPFGDHAGIGTGRNWSHVNSIDYDAKDDSIILSLRHQGTVKVGRDKKVKWILAGNVGWKGLSDKVLTPVDDKGRKLDCNRGVCEGDFDFPWTQHTAWLTDRDTLTVFDNGDGRGFDQPAMPTMKYSRGVEYKIDEDKMTVEQVWEYGKERGYDWYSAVTSNVNYMSDKDSMLMFSASAGLFDKGRSHPILTEVSADQDKDIKVEIRINHVAPRLVMYRAQVLDVELAF
ncbi:aryl-sulfate sulfotransferase [Shewanella youngdeokensis]|uniref:Aryl-sulfate sulfotransferase n=1 Tax=Shewanella youngdeokensis TaxID=2999068 RepID=A0ABZ0K4E1_9GAMM|nr:aryl-sulfate sulfotransferase [Shewanella sp. DAU334]